MITTKTLPSLMICAQVMLTVSENFNMEFLREEAATEAPMTAVKRALVGGYEIFSPFTLGNGLPLLATVPRSCELRGDFHAKPWPRSLVAAVNPHTPFA